MKKTLFSVILTACFSVLGLSQSVDLDRHHASLEYVNLPSMPIENPALRTYFVESGLDGLQKTKLMEAMNLPGFELKDNADATLHIVVKIEGIQVKKVDIETNKHETKDKDGNVTNTTYTYKPYIVYSSKGEVKAENKEGRGYAEVFGSSTNFFYPRDEKNSPHLTFTEYKKASDYLNLNYNRLVQEIQNDFNHSVIYNSSVRIKERYAYPTYKDNILFWILDSKKIPEYEGYQNKMKEIKTLFSKIKAQEPIESLKPELAPIENYFLEILPKYTDSKRPHRKMRYASYFNLAQLYLAFDMPEKAIEMADKISGNDYDAKDGAMLKERAEKLIKLMEVNKTNTRHFQVK